MSFLDVTIKKNFKVGMYVEILEEKTQKSYKGYILNILSKKDNQSGIKVELTNHIIGNVLEIYTIDKIKLENFKFYNKIFNTKTIYSIWNEKDKCFAIIDYCHHTINYTFPSLIISNEKQDIVDFINSNKLDVKVYKIRTLNPNKDIYKHFNVENEVMVLIKNEKYLRFSKFKEIENEIKIKTKTTR